MSEVAQKIRREQDRCPYCHDDLCAVEQAAQCEGCGALHHPQCWAEGNSSCSACGVGLSTEVSRTTCRVAGCDRATQGVTEDECDAHTSRSRGNSALVVGLFVCVLPWAGLALRAEPLPWYGVLVLAALQLPFLALFLSGLRQRLRGREPE